MFADADLESLTPGHVSKVLKPVIEGKAVMSIGLRDRVFGLGALIPKINPMYAIGGERAMTRKFFNDIPKDKNTLDFGIETVMNYYARYQNATPEENAKLNKERDAREKMWHEKEKIFEKHLFLVAVPVGIAAIVFGAASSIQAIGTGLMFGGIFTLIDGYCWYWSELQDWMRFLSLLAAFVVLIFIGYRKLAK